MNLVVNVAVAVFGPMFANVDNGQSGYFIFSIRFSFFHFIFQISLDIQDEKWILLERERVEQNRRERKKTKNNVYEIEMRDEFDAKEQVSRVFAWKIFSLMVLLKQNLLFKLN